MNGIIIIKILSCLYILPPWYLLTSVILFMDWDWPTKSCPGAQMCLLYKFRCNRNYLIMIIYIFFKYLHYLYYLDNLEYLYNLHNFDYVCSRTIYRVLPVVDGSDATKRGTRALGCGLVTGRRHVWYNMRHDSRELWTCEVQSRLFAGFAKTMCRLNWIQLNCIPEDSKSCIAHIIITWLYAHLFTCMCFHI